MQEEPPTQFDPISCCFSVRVFKCFKSLRRFYRETFQSVAERYAAEGKRNARFFPKQKAKNSDDKTISNAPRVKLPRDKNIVNGSNCTTQTTMHLLFVDSLCGSTIIEAVGKRIFERNGKNLVQYGCTAVWIGRDIDRHEFSCSWLIYIKSRSKFNNKKKNE